MKFNGNVTTLPILLLLALLAGCRGPNNKTDEPPTSTGSSDRTGYDPTAFQSTLSGLRYRILREGDGPMPTVRDRVTVHYRGWLDDGSEFDSSYKRGQPAKFPLSQVVPGWTEGLQLVGEGGKIELEIPAELGYGKQGTPDGSIPPGATLHFEVELLNVER